MKITRFKAQKGLKIQDKINKLNLNEREAKKLIYGYTKRLNKFKRIGSRNITTCFLCDSGLGRGYIEVFNGEKGEKVFTFNFKY